MITPVLPYVYAEAVFAEAMESGVREDTAQTLRPVQSDPWSEGGLDLWFYRYQTIALLKKYARLSVEVGRLPSLLGREFFRARAKSYRAVSFEDVVIFVHDVEQSLEKLDGFGKKLVGMVVLEEFSQDEAAAILGCSRSTVVRYLTDALDRLSEIFLKGDILRRVNEPEKVVPESCQEGGTEENFANCWSEGRNIF